MTNTNYQTTPANTTENNTSEKNISRKGSEADKMQHAFSQDIQAEVFTQTNCPWEIERIVIKLICMYYNNRGPEPITDMPKYADWWLAHNLLGIEALEKSDEALQSYGKRAREKLIEWQQKTGITYVTFFIGGGLKKLESSFELHILDLIVFVKRALEEKRLGNARKKIETIKAIKNHLHLITNKQSRVDLVTRKNAAYENRTARRQEQPYFQAAQFADKMLAKNLDPVRVISEVMQKTSNVENSTTYQDRGLFPAPVPGRFDGTIEQLESSDPGPQEDTVNVKLLFDNELIADETITQAGADFLLETLRGIVFPRNSAPLNSVTRSIEPLQNVYILNKEYTNDFQGLNNTLTNYAQSQSSEVKEHGGGAVTGSPHVGMALEMIEIFESVAPVVFDVTLTNLEQQKTEFLSGLPGDQMANLLPYLLPECNQGEVNLIVRPRSDAMTFIQLDDLGETELSRVENLSLLMLETSPGSYQSWLAIERATPELIRRIKQGIGADMNASGATRIAGSFNFKPEYSEDFPIVIVAACAPGRVVTIEEIERAGILAREEENPPPRHAPRVMATRFPSYALCLENAPPARKHEGPDRSNADFNYCLLAIGRGFSQDDIVERLLIESDNASKKGRKYALHTVLRAFEIADKRKGHE